jgi:hypothetical protein
LYPFGWDQRTNAGTPWIVAAFDNAEIWPMIMELGVSNDGVPIAIGSPLQGLSLSLVETRCAATSPESSSRYEPMEPDFESYAPLPAPAPD